LDASNEVSFDSKTVLILLATTMPKTAMEISHDCYIPLSTTYRKLDMLLDHNLVKIFGRINNGRRYLLYTNSERIHLFKNSQRALIILNIIIQNPGICFRDIARISGLTNGVVSHYLFKLQMEGLVHVKRSKRKTWYFILDISEEEMKLAVHLRNKTSCEIISKLLENQCLTFNTLTKKINKCPASISFGLSRLVEEGIVKRMGGLHPMYFLKDPRFISKMMANMHSKTV
jgi:predicted transcriptional regulator